MLFMMVLLLSKLMLIFWFIFLIFIGKKSKFVRILIIMSFGCYLMVLLWGLLCWLFYMCSWVMLKGFMRFLFVVIVLMVFYFLEFWLNVWEGVVLVFILLLVLVEFYKWYYLVLVVYILMMKGFSRGVNNCLSFGVN